jgi:hypothetical protein
VQVPTSNVDASGIGRRPEPGDGADHVGERELGLMGRRINQRHPGCGLADGADPDARKTPVDPHGAEQIRGPPHPVEVPGLGLETLTWDVARVVVWDLVVLPAK